MQLKKLKQYLNAIKRKVNIMPMGKGTYGSKRGRPPKKKKNKYFKKKKK